VPRRPPARQVPPRSTSSSPSTIYIEQPVSPPRLHSARLTSATGSQPERHGCRSDQAAQGPVSSSLPTGSPLSAHPSATLAGVWRVSEALTRRRGRPSPSVKLDFRLLRPRNGTVAQEALLSLTGQLARRGAILHWLKQQGEPVAVGDAVVGLAPSTALFSCRHRSLGLCWSS
jgi:hypothetical protein